MRSAVSSKQRLLVGDGHVAETLWTKGLCVRVIKQRLYKESSRSRHIQDLLIAANARCGQKRVQTSPYKPLEGGRLEGTKDEQQRPLRNEESLLGSSAFKFTLRKVPSCSCNVERF